MFPRILLVCTTRWFATARLAKALVSAGARVEAVCPSDHPMAKMRSKPREYRFSALMPVRSISKAIRAAQPDFVIPADDLATDILHRIYHCAQSVGDVRTADLIECSLGDAANFAVTTSRSWLMAVAHDLGVRVPRTGVVTSAGELVQRLDDFGFPAVLKVDGTYGGRGVRIIRNASDANKAWPALSSPPSIARAAKRALVNRDMNYMLACLRQARPVVNVQQFIGGFDANSTAACWRGRVVASVTVTVIRTLGDRGPSSVVRVINNEEMSESIAKIASKLGLTGLFGFDFVVDTHTANPYLIELNPRATQVCHLQLGQGRDLAASLSAAFSGAEIHSPSPSTTNRVISLFPQEWLRDPRSEFLMATHHDVPWDEPEFIQLCIKEGSAHRLWDALSPAVEAADRAFEKICRRVRRAAPEMSFKCGRQAELKRSNTPNHRAIVDSLGPK